MSEQEKPMYGIWQPGKGWLRGSDLFADYDLAKARQVARLIGGGARVQFIDKAIVELEQKYLEQESRTLWHTFKNLFKHKTSKSHKAS